MKTDAFVRAESALNQQNCLVGAYCSHARATETGSKILKRLPLPCIFWDDVLCSFRRDTKDKIMDKCLNCCEYARFLRDMDAEDKKVMDQIDEIHRTGVWK